jgi:hypothetical protein
MVVGEAKAVCRGQRREVRIRIIVKPVSGAVSGALQS